ncbi:MAG TPA: hypothetical protein VFE06_03525 [Acidobacteriaceae bacterium]|nr:hypothetical protein [Acidobacteriaceae bacterium]
MATQQAGFAANSARSTIANASALSRFLNKYFYFCMSLIILVLVTVMFSTTVPGRLFHPKIAPPSIVWLHGTVFYGWVLFFILQSGLVKIRKTRWHRTIGWFGLALGAAVLALGLSTTIVMHRFEFLSLHQGPAAIIGISIPLWDMSCFAVVFCLAILWRRKLEYHRRLMLIASCTLTAAAWGRLPESVLPGFWFYAGVDLLILMGLVRDLLVDRKIHRVYLITLPLYIAGQIAISQITPTAWWMRIANGILF